MRPLQRLWWGFGPPTRPNTGQPGMEDSVSHNNKNNMCIYIYIYTHICHGMCHVVLCHVTLYRVMLCCIALCYVMLCCVMLCRIAYVCMITRVRVYIYSNLYTYIHTREYTYTFVKRDRSELGRRPQACAYIYIYI